jgi:hypothetical protein
VSLKERMKTDMIPYHYLCLRVHGTQRDDRVSLWPLLPAEVMLSATVYTTDSGS